MKPSRRHRAALPALLIALAGAAGLSACFIEAQPGATFRFECSTSDDCPSAEQCISGLCQIPCTTASFAEDCPSEGDYVACFNGVCANSCDTQSDTCPSPTECVGSTDAGGDFGLPTVGICGELCDPSVPDSCPANELCAFGICVTPCDDATAPCGDGESCVSGVCVPTDDSGSAGGDS